MKSHVQRSVAVFRYARDRRHVVSKFVFLCADCSASTAIVGMLLMQWAAMWCCIQPRHRVLPGQAPLMGLQRHILISAIVMLRRWVFNQTVGLHSGDKTMGM